MKVYLLESGNHAVNNAEQEIFYFKPKFKSLKALIMWPWKDL